MVAGGTLAVAKAHLLQLLALAYRQRDRVALLCFGAGRVELRMPPQRAPGWRERWVAPIPGGGGTPLAAAVQRADALMRAQPAGLRCLWLLTDGGSTARPARPQAADGVQVIDYERRRAPIGRARDLALSWGAQYLAIRD